MATIGSIGPRPVASATTINKAPAGQRTAILPWVRLAEQATFFNSGTAQEWGIAKAYALEAQKVYDAANTTLKTAIRTIRPDFTIDLKV